MLLVDRSNSVQVLLSLRCRELAHSRFSISHSSRCGAPTGIKAGCAQSRIEKVSINGIFMRAHLGKARFGLRIHVRNDHGICITSPLGMLALKVLNHTGSTRNRKPIGQIHQQKPMSQFNRAIGNGPCDPRAVGSAFRDPSRDPHQSHEQHTAALPLRK